jgi:hypothetical protein
MDGQSKVKDLLIIFVSSTTLVTAVLVTLTVTLATDQLFKRLTSNDGQKLYTSVNKERMM